MNEDVSPAHLHRVLPILRVIVRHVDEGLVATFLLSASQAFQQRLSDVAVHPAELLLGHLECGDPSRWETSQAWKVLEIDYNLPIFHWARESPISPFFCYKTLQTS